MQTAEMNHLPPKFYYLTLHKTYGDNLKINEFSKTTQAKYLILAEAL